MVNEGFPRKFGPFASALYSFCHSEYLLRHTITDLRENLFEKAESEKQVELEVQEISTIKLPQVEGSIWSLEDEREALKRKIQRMRNNIDASETQ